MKKINGVAKSANTFAPLASIDREPRTRLQVLTDRLASQVLGGAGNGTVEPPIGG